MVAESLRPLAAWVGLVGLVGLLGSIGLVGAGSGWVGRVGRVGCLVRGRSGGSGRVITTPQDCADSILPRGYVMVARVRLVGRVGRVGCLGRVISTPQDRADSILPRGYVMVAECIGPLLRSLRPLLRVPGCLGWVGRVDRLGRSCRAGWVRLGWSGRVGCLVRGQGPVGWVGSAGDGRVPDSASLVSESRVWSRNLGAWSLNPMSGLGIWLPGL